MASLVPAIEPLELDETDIEGAYLSTPLDAHTVEQLKWWLLCHGCKYQVNDRKKDLIQM